MEKLKLKEGKSKAPGRKLVGYFLASLSFRETDLDFEVPSPTPPGTRVDEDTHLLLLPLGPSVLWKVSFPSPS